MTSERIEELADFAEGELTTMPPVNTIEGAMRHHSAVKDIAKILRWMVDDDDIRELDEI